MKLSLWWMDFVEGLESAMAVLCIGLGIAGIIAITVLAIVKIRKINSVLAIITPTFVSCILMILVISSFNNLVFSGAGRSIINEAKDDVRAARSEAARLRAEQRVRELEREKIENQLLLGRQSLEIQSLSDNIKLLENANISMQSFSKILEVALLETQLKQTRVWKEDINPRETGWGLRADYFNDEALIVNTYDIIAKFGVDLNQIKISRLDDNSVIVSGIAPKFIGTSRNIRDNIVTEFRRVNYKRGEIASVEAKYDGINHRTAVRVEQERDRAFQTQLSQGLELGFMDDAVIQLARNFIRVILAPLFDDIRFSHTELPGAMPVMEFIKKEIEEKQGRIIELQEVFMPSINEQNSEIDNEIEEIIEEFGLNLIDLEPAEPL